MMGVSKGKKISKNKEGEDKEEDDEQGKGPSKEAEQTKLEDNLKNKQDMAEEKDER